MKKNIRIGEILIEYGYITEKQLNEALEYQKTNANMRLGEALIELGFVAEKDVLKALAARMQLKTINLKTYHIDYEAVSKIPRQIAEKYNVIAVDIIDGRLKLVMSDPLNFYALEDVRQIAHMPIDTLLDLKKNIANAIEYYYAEIDAKEATRMANSTVAEQLDITLDDEIVGDDAPVVQVLNSLIVRGFSINASDIHIEPFEKHVSVRMRVDGVITDYVTLSKNLHTSLVARIKILSNLDIAERRIPQDGHFKTNINGVDLNCRVSIIPTVFGEKTVVRFLSTQVKVDNFGYYGMTEDNYLKFKKALDSPYGIVYITGPTGSGKTTTLYMVLEQVAKKLVNISTIEDPVERNLERVNQVQVNNAAGLTFESGLRSLLRQDPDIIMVGETRDNETASISVRAAITGHLVFSTLHTNDAISSIVRLRDMGIPSYLVANSVVGLVAQRLMRKICPYCGYEYDATQADKKTLGKDIKKLRAGKGCHVCNNTGYKGRIAVHEVVLIDKRVRHMIATEEPIEHIYEYVREKQNFKSLRDSALALVESGTTTVEEFYKVAHYFE